MQQRTRRKLLMCAIITGVAMAGGSALGLGSLMLTGGSESQPELGLLRGMLTGLFIALPMTLWEFFYANGPSGAWLRQRKFLSNVGIRALVYLVGFLSGIWLGATLVPDSGLPQPGFNTQTAIQVVFAASLTLVANFMIGIDRLLGQNVFRNFLTGRYHRPVVENHILLFADLEGSTSLAEEIGDLAFHEFLNSIYRQLGVPVSEHGGIVHKYVGDEMIASWPDSRDNRRQALKCGLALIAAMRAEEPQFRDRFGTTRMIRCAIHTGPVVIGEMGDIRQEIVYLGDAMNVTARLVDLCATYKRGMLASGAVLETAAAEDFAIVEPMGPVELPGRQAPLNVASLKAMASFT